MKVVIQFYTKKGQFLKLEKLYIPKSNIRELAREVKLYNNENIDVASFKII